MNIFGGRPETEAEREQRLARIKESGRKVVITEVKNGYLLYSGYVDDNTDDLLIHVAPTIPTALELAKELLEEKS